MYALTNTLSKLSERIVDFALSLKLEHVPEEVIRHGKMLLLDTFGVALSCRDLEHAEAVRKVVQAFGSAPQATLWTTDAKASIADAALYNAALIHGADYDDTHVGGIVHPSASVVSTALSVGEYTGASGEMIMEAIVVGWEVIVRLALAAKGRFHDVGYHGTGILAPFAAVCVAAKLMAVSPKAAVNAFGICGSQAAALQEFLHDGSWVKKIHPGWGAHSAIYALCLAKEGFSGPSEVLEGGFGLWKTHIGTTDGLEEAFSNLGTFWHTPEITFKMYPVCHMIHSFIGCMLRLRKEHAVAAEDIASMECRIEPRCYHIVCAPREQKVRPRTDYMMRFSLPYVLAVTALKHRMSPWEIDMRYAEDVEVQALMDKVQCISDEEKSHPGYFPGWLKITTTDGKSYVAEQKYELGTPQNPISMDEVIVKFNNNVDTILASEKKMKIVDAIRDFEKMTAADVSALIRQFRA